MNSTSNINDLPNSFVGGGSNESNQIYNSNIKLDTAEIPRANIPLSTEKISTDEQVKVNFVPETENNVYYIPHRSEENKDVEKSESLFDVIEKLELFDTFILPKSALLLSFLLKKPFSLLIFSISSFILILKFL